MNGLIAIFIFFPIFLFSAIIHECAHGFAAYLCGDETAKRAGRLTLNPIPHIDPMMSIILPIIIFILSGFRFIFGGAKPVPFNYLNLRYPKYQIPLIAIAGPLSNLILAFIFGFIYALFSKFIPFSEDIHIEFMKFIYMCVFINILLFTFNLIPFPPLDGSKVLYLILPMRYIKYLLTFEEWGLIILVGILFFTNFFSHLIFFIDSISRGIMYFCLRIII